MESNQVVSPWSEFIRMLHNDFVATGTALAAQPPVLPILAAVLPLLVYPFLPVFKGSHIRPRRDSCALWLSGISSWNILLYHITRIAFFHSKSTAPMHFQMLGRLMLLGLTVTIWSACASSIRCSSQCRVIKQKDFKHAASLLYTFTWVQIFSFFLDYGIDSGLVQKWYHWGFFMILLVLFGLPLTYLFVEVVPVILYRFVTRQYRWWTWLPVDGSEEEFAPWWSVTLAVGVSILAPVLSLLALWQ